MFRFVRFVMFMFAFVSFSLAHIALWAVIGYHTRLPGWLMVPLTFGSAVLGSHLLLGSYEDAESAVAEREARAEFEARHGRRPE